MARGASLPISVCTVVALLAPASVGAVPFPEGGFAVVDTVPSVSDGSPRGAMTPTATAPAGQSKIKGPTAPQAAPQPVLKPTGPSAVNFPARTSTQHGAHKGTPKGQSKTGFPQAAVAPNTALAGTGPGCAGQYTVDSWFYSPDPTSGSWVGDVNTDCVPGVVPATFLLTAVLTDYNGGQVGAMQQTNPSGVTTPFDWKPNFGLTSIPTTDGSYTYTAHYYRQTDIPQNTQSEFDSPDVFCNQGYGLRNPDPNNSGLYLEEFCYMNMSYTVTIAHGSCTWSQVGLTQDGRGNADATGSVSCSGLPSDTTSHGAMVFDDWSGQAVPGYEPHSVNGGSGGFLDNTGPVSFANGQQLQAKLTSTVMFSAASGWTWTPGGSCTVLNGGLTVQCVGTSAGLTIQIQATPTPTPVPDDPSLCAASISPPLDHGDRTADFLMTLTVVSGTSLQSLTYTFHWENTDSQVGSPSFTDVQSILTPPSPTYSITFPNQLTRGGLQISASFDGRAQVQTGTGSVNCPFSVVSSGMVVVTQFIDNNDGNPSFGLQHAYDDHVKAPGNAASTWISPNSYFIDGTTKGEVGTLVQQSVAVRPQQQGMLTNNRFQRIADSSGPVGFDNGPNYQQTGRYTVITTADGLLVTTFPGTP